MPAPTAQSTDLTHVTLTELAPADHRGARLINSIQTGFPAQTANGKVIAISAMADTLLNQKFVLAFFRSRSIVSLLLCFVSTDLMIYALCPFLSAIVTVLKQSSISSRRATATMACKVEALPFPPPPSKRADEFDAKSYKVDVIPLPHLEQLYPPAQTRKTVIHNPGARFLRRRDFRIYAPRRNELWVAMWSSWE